MYDLIILTDDRYENPSDPDWYDQQILTEDGLVQEACEALGLKVGRFSWSNPSVDWSTTKAVIFRTTWDYFDRFDAFKAWMDAISTQTICINAYDQLLWNIDKHYLSDLKKAGVNIPPTRFIEPEETQSLSTILAQSGWDKTVLKPAIAGGARLTYVVTAENVAEKESVFQELLQNGESWLLQPFQNDVVESGELSLMVINGKFTHSIKKIAKAGDFRVQDDYGGSVHEHTATAEEIAFAEKAVAACDPLPLYARADIIRDNDGALAIAELELIEPEMWFRFHAPAAADLAVAIQQHLSGV